MEKEVYITEEERVKCQKVADAFAELYEMVDIVVVDVGRNNTVEVFLFKKLAVTNGSIKQGKALSMTGFLL